MQSQLEHNDLHQKMAGSCMAVGSFIRVLCGAAASGLIKHTTSRPGRQWKAPERWWPFKGGASIALHD